MGWLAACNVFFQYLLWEEDGGADTQEPFESGVLKETEGNVQAATAGRRKLDQLIDAYNLPSECAKRRWVEGDTLLELLEGATSGLSLSSFCISFRHPILCNYNCLVVRVSVSNSVYESRVSVCMKVCASVLHVMWLTVEHSVGKCDVVCDSVFDAYVYACFCRVCVCCTRRPYVCISVCMQVYICASVHLCSYVATYLCSCVYVMCTMHKTLGLVECLRTRNC